MTLRDCNYFSLSLSFCHFTPSRNHILQYTPAFNTRPPRLSSFIQRRRASIVSLEFKCLTLVFNWLCLLPIIAFNLIFLYQKCYINWRRKNYRKFEDLGSWIQKFHYLIFLHHLYPECHFLWSSVPHWKTDTVRLTATSQTSRYFLNNKVHRITSHNHNKKLSVKIYLQFRFGSGDLLVLHIDNFNC